MSGVRTGALSRRATQSGQHPPSAQYKRSRENVREAARVSARPRVQGRIPAVVFSQSFDVGSDGVVRSVERKRLLAAERKKIIAIMKDVESDELFLHCTRFPWQISAGAGLSCWLNLETFFQLRFIRIRETGQILNLVFAWVDDGEVIKFDVLVAIKGDEASPGLKRSLKQNQ